MYIFIDKANILPYNGEVLKRFVGNRLVKAISNPNETDLEEFGYMELVDDPVPEYDEKTQFLSFEYQVKSGQIHKVYTVCDMENVIENNEVE